MPWNNTTPTEYYIGIDCGTKTGFAVWDKKHKKFERVSTVMIHQAMEAILDLHKSHKVHVLVEDARKAGYRARTAAQKAKEVAQAQGAGSVKRDCSIWEDFLKDKGISHEMKAPNYRITKLDKEQFARYTGWTGLTCSHGRDAAMIVYSK